MNEPSLKTRREFLRTSILGGAMTWTVPSFVQATLQALMTAQADGAPALTGKDGPILVLLQLAGGNDGLNTVVPFSDDDYHRARPNLALAQSEVLRLNGDVGLHPAMTALKDLYDSGNLAIIQGVGYPNPNRSHFRSTEIWHTASDADRYEQQGWVGRYFDNQCQGMDASCGICLGGETPQAFFAKSPKGVTFQNAQNFRFLPGDAGENENDLFRTMNGMDEASSGGSIGSLSGGHRAKPGENTLDFLERTALDAQVSSDRIRAIASKSQGRGNYPGSRLGQEFSMIARLIAGGMPTRVYYLSQGGFDTHSNQAGSHERLLREYSEAMKAFMDDMKKQGNDQRVMVLTFSEFGRRVSENASGGTDHGAAAPVFISGGRVQAGLLGKAPSLKAADLDQGDVRHNVDFRSVYATLLEKHMSAGSKTILGRSYPLLNFMA